MDSPWSMQCHDNRHTSRSPFSTVNITNLEKWRFRTRYGYGGGIDGSPIIDNKGDIYFGSLDQMVYSLYPNGTLKWKYETDMWITSTPALAEDGTLYVGSWDHYLYAFNSTSGIRKWKFYAHHTIDSSPAIGNDGTIYFGTMGTGGKAFRIYAVNPNGTERWYYTTGYKITSDPAIGDDGTIYIGSGDTYLYAINSNGTLKWRIKTGDLIMGSPSIADDDTIYIASWDGYLYAIFPHNGTIKWKCKIGVGSKINPSIAADGTIYIGCEKLYAIYPNGTINWTFNPGKNSLIVWSSPAISSEGTIYFGTRIGDGAGGDIIAVNPNGTEKWRKQICYEWCDSSPAIAEDGTVYIGSQCEGHGYLHAFGPVESNSPPETPTISGKRNGTNGEWYEYTFRVIDPDNNPISWYIEWGDGKQTGWTTERASNEKCYYGHKWSEEGGYTIRVKARDVLGEESEWGILKVTMPKSQNVYQEWANRFSIFNKLLDI
jgi:outer membrane protein assembly factor BamB